MHINPNQSYYYKCDEREIEDTATVIYYLQNTVMEHPLNQGEQKLVDAICKQGESGSDLFAGHGKNTDQYIKLRKLMKKQGLEPLDFELNGDHVPYSQENTRKLAWKRGYLKAQQQLSGNTPTPSKPKKVTNTVDQYLQNETEQDLALVFVLKEQALVKFLEGDYETAVELVQGANDIISCNDEVKTAIKQAELILGL